MSPLQRFDQPHSPALDRFAAEHFRSRSTSSLPFATLWLGRQSAREVIRPAIPEACRQIQAWLAAGLPAVPVSVNISAVEFRHLDFIKGVTLILEETGLDPRLGAGSGETQGEGRQSGH